MPPETPADDVALDQPYALPADAAERYERDGFVRLAGVLPPKQ
jgi:hypothetical protein